MYMPSYLGTLSSDDYDYSRMTVVDVFIALYRSIYVLLFVKAEMQRNVLRLFSLQRRLNFAAPG